jgi:hypothetical protein
MRRLLGRREILNHPSKNLWGLTLSGEATREPPAQTELCRTCAGASRVARYDRTQAGSLCYIGFPDYGAISERHPGSYSRERGAVHSTTS